MGKRRLMRLLGLCLMVVNAGLTLNAQAGRLVWGGCPTLPEDAASAARMQCGWLHTGTDMDGEPVRLRVVALRARPGHQSAHPVIYIPGGPGDPAGLSGAELVKWRRFQQRAGWPVDLILFDPRGTGASQPRPDCRGRQSTPRQGPRRAGRCYQVIGPETANALGPMAQVHDIVSLIDALNVDSATLWAVSYGTRIARSVAAEASPAVRSLILDSPVSTLDSATADRHAAEERAVAALIAYCRAHLACRLAVPSARLAIAGLLATASRQAPFLIWADVPRRPTRMRLTPSRLLAMIVLAGYRPEADAVTLARLQRAARTGELGALAPLAATLAGVVDNRGHSRAVYCATRCAYQRSQSVAQPGLDGSSWLSRYWSAPPDHACKAWPVRPVSLATGKSRVPTLLINGGRDPITPAVGAANDADPRRLSVIVPGAGHAPTLTSPCAWRMVAGFLADTVQGIRRSDSLGIALDNRCAADRAGELDRR